MGYWVGQGFVSRNACRNMRGVYRARYSYYLGLVAGTGLLVLWIIVVYLLIFSQDSRAPGDPASSSDAETTDQTDGQNSQWLKLQCDRARCEAEQAKHEALDAKKQAKVL